MKSFDPSKDHKANLSTLKYCICNPSNPRMTAQNTSTLQKIAKALWSFNPSEECAQSHMQSFNHLKDCEDNPSTLRRIDNAIFQPLEGSDRILQSFRGLQKD